MGSPFSLCPWYTLVSPKIFHHYSFQFLLCITVVPSLLVEVSHGKMKNDRRERETFAGLAYFPFVNGLCHFYWSALDSASEVAPFSPDEIQLNKVELFSAFISHLDDISSWKCS